MDEYYYTEDWKTVHFVRDGEDKIALVGGEAMTRDEIRKAVADHAKIIGYSGRLGIRVPIAWAAAHPDECEAQ